MLGSETVAHLVDEVEDRNLLIAGESEIVGFVALRYDECVAGADGKAVWEGGCQVVADGHLTRSDVLAKHTGTVPSRVSSTGSAGPQMAMRRFLAYRHIY